MSNQVRPPSGTIQRSNGKASITTLVLPSRSEHVITLHGRDIADMDGVLRAEAAALHAQVFNRFVSGDGHDQAVLCPGAPATNACLAWLQAEPGRDNQISSVQAFALSGAQPVPVRWRGSEVGLMYEDEYARYCRLHAFTPGNRNAPREAQAQEVFLNLDAALQANGFRFTDTVRTWIYLDRLLEWYKEFNTVRTAFFADKGVFAKLLPASTGIASGNPWGFALTCGLLAVQPKTDAVRIQAVSSPLQCPAPNYKSSFSRAVELAFPTHRSLLISGTASIDPDGQSANLGDPARQIELTMNIVEALLNARGMNWDCLSRGIAYFSDLGNAPLFTRYCQAHGVPASAVALAQAGICRPELLFEIEADAVTAVRE